MSAWMPSEPTIRVIGSHDIRLTLTFLPGWGVASTVDMSLSPLPLPALLVARGELGPVVTPLRLLVVLPLDVQVAAPLQERAVREARRRRGDPAHGVGVHERHVLVGEARHRAGHADAADVRAAADPVDPPAQRHVALDDGALAAELDQAAVVGAVLGGEVAHLVERGAVAALVR